jgi:hypothetical protein
MQELSTKAASFAALDPKRLSRTRELILQKLQVEPLTRAELAAKTGLRLSSVCGRCNELLKAGRIFVSGTALDEETNRNVEILEAVKEQP